MFDEFCHRFIRFYISCRKSDIALLKNYRFLREDTLAAFLVSMLQCLLHVWVTVFK
jgi:hypothetical protein